MLMVLCGMKNMVSTEALVTFDHYNSIYVIYIYIYIALFTRVWVCGGGGDTSKSFTVL